ncbi:MAG: NUDIX domain-containing protein [Bdellovibrionales bacterium]|nr:NUDIX domain-containing protein [Bdellovibrionales bacterium]
MVAYPLVQTVAGSDEVGVGFKRTRGVFCLPINSEGKVALARRTPDAPTYPNCWNCFGGGVGANEAALEFALGREFNEESHAQIRSVQGLVGRPLEKVVVPKDIDKPVWLDTAEAFLVEYEGSLQLTDETREVGWFGFTDLLELGEDLVGMESTPIGRTARFAFWGVSIGKSPIYDGPVTDQIDQFFSRPLIPCSSTPLVDDDRYLIRCTLTHENRRNLRVWRSLEPGVVGGYRAGELENVL